jgi:hypothetical protein
LRRAGAGEEIRDRRGFGNGSAFAVMETKEGALFFRPVNAKPKLDLIEQPKRLKGLELPEIHAHCSATRNVRHFPF